MDGTANQPEIPSSHAGDSAAGIALETGSPAVDQGGPVVPDDPVEPPGPVESPAGSGVPERPQHPAEIPTILAEASQAQLYAHFHAEYEPVGPTELTLVKILARHAAGAELWGQGGGAVGRQTARHLPQLLRGTDGAGESLHPLSDDVILSGTLVNEAVDRCERHSVRRAREFTRTLAILTEMQATRRHQECRGTTMPPLGFPDETACETYLLARLEGGLVACPECGSTAGWMLGKRKRRECRDCQHQIGLRSNTVMAHSAVSLRQWFDAIRLLLWQPTIRATKLSAQLGVPRLATVRSMTQKIREALASDHTSDLLAGLDRHFTACIST